MSDKYRDIIDLPHPTSTRHPRMPAADRAAQFAPFAALVGYEDAVSETARLTDERPALSDDAKTVLDRRLRRLADQITDSPTVTLTYFVPDAKKHGGSCLTVTGKLKRIDTYEHTLTLTDGTVIHTEDLIALH